MFNLLTKWPFFVLVVLAVACGGDSEEYRFGFNTTGIEFVFFDVSEGIFPSRVTLSNPNNPFREYAIGSRDQVRHPRRWRQRGSLLRVGSRAGG